MGIPERENAYFRRKPARADRSHIFDSPFLQVVFFFAACVRLGPRWVPLWLNHQGNHAHRHAPAEPAPSHPTRSIGSPPATTSACSVDPQAGAVGAVAGPIQLRRSHSPYPTRGQESGARQSWSTARCASRLLWAADHVPGPVRDPRARTSRRDGPSAHCTDNDPRREHSSAPVAY